MKNLSLYLLLVLAIFACKPDGNNTAKKEEKTTQQVKPKDTLPALHGPQLLPIDEAEKDTSFLEFRKRLLEAIYAHDEKYLLSVLDKNIKIGFGGGDGIKEFKKKWEADNYEQLWPVMKRILENGGAFMKDNNGKDLQQHIFQAPYVFSNWPDSLDAFELSAIIHERTPIYKQATTESEILTKLSYEIVDVELFIPEENSKERFIYIKTLDGKVKGYTDEENLYSPVGYRALFGKVNGKWKLQALVAGD